MFGPRFTKELQMIDDALAHEQGEKVFVQYINPYVEKVVDTFIETNSIVLPREALVTAAWTHFPRALIRYRDRADKMLAGENDIYYFTTYFNWYARQGMIEWIRTNGHSEIS